MIDFPYRVERSMRKTLSISITAQGEVVCHAPLFMPQDTILRFLGEKEGWIRTHRAERLQQNSRIELRDGASIPWLGQEITLRMGNVPRVVLRESELWVPTSGDAARKLNTWRSTQARITLKPKASEWSQRLGLPFTAFSVGNAGTRWGSMSSDGHLRLNSALMHLPGRLQDFVIVHELCHTLQMNHSQAFHALVRQVFPDEKELQKLLNRYSYCIRLFKE